MISLELSEIKAIAMDELGECVLNSQELPGAFFGMRALIKRLAEFDDAGSASVPRGGEGDTPPSENEKRKKEPAKIEKSPEEKPETPSAENNTESFRGPQAKLKRQTLDRLRMFRASMPLSQIAAASNGTLSSDDLLAMLLCKKLPIEKWTCLAAALDALHKED